MQKEKIETIYKDVLAGNRKRFPLYTWSKDEYGYENFQRCLRYIANKLNLSREQIVDIDHAFIKRYKLKGGLEMLYGQNIKPAIMNAFPELDLKEWEFFRVSKSEDFVITALQEIVERKGWTRETFLEKRSELYKDADMYRVLNWLIKNDREVAPFLLKALPDFDFTAEELTQRLNREKINDEIKDIFENKLKWTEEDIINKMTVDVAKEHFRQAYRIHRNVLDMVRSVYPDIIVLKAIKMPLSDEAKECIISDVKAGYKTKEITEKYGIGRTTLGIIKRENGLVRKRN